MKKLAKILAVVLSLALLVCGIVIVASAEGEVASATKADGTDAGVHTTVAEAITAAGEGGTVTLLADVTEAITVANDLTLDLNGKTLTSTDTATVEVTAGNVTVKNGNIVNANTGTDGKAVFRKGDSKLVISEVNITSNRYGVFVDANATREIAEGEYHLVIENSSISAVNNSPIATQAYAYINGAFTTSYPKDTDWIVYDAVTKAPYHTQIVSDGYTDGELVDVYLGANGKYYSSEAAATEAGTTVAETLQLVEGYPYHYTEIKVTDSELAVTGNGGAYLLNSAQIEHKSDTGANVSNPNFTSQRHAMANVTFDSCRLSGNSYGFLAYGNTITFNNCVTTFRGDGTPFGANVTAINQIFFQNGLFVTENSAFIFPRYTEYMNGTTAIYFRVANGGNSSHFKFGEGTYFSNISNLFDKSGSTFKALDEYGAAGIMVTSKSEAYIPSCFEYHGVKAPALGGYEQDFSDVKFSYTPASEDTAAAEGWVIPGVNFDFGNGTVAVGEAYAKLTLDAVAYFGHYNNDFDLATIVPSGTRYSSRVKGKSIGYTPFEDIGIHAADFDLKSDVDVALFLHTVDSALADAYTGSVTVAATDEEWVHVTLVTKMVDGLTVTNVYVNGELVGAANFNTSAAVGIKGIGVKSATGEGSFAVDNVSLVSYATDYTAADVLFERGTNAPLTAWADAYAEAQIGEEKYVKLEDAIAAAAEGETLTLLRTLSYTVEINNAVVIDTNGNELTYELKVGYVAAANGDIITVTKDTTATKVKWYLDKNKETFVEASYAAGEEIVLPEDAEVVGEYETYLDANGTAVDAPYEYDANGELKFKTALTGASDLEKWVWNGEWTVTENEDGSLEYAPVYVGGIASITTSAGVVTYYERFLEFETAFEASTSKDATAKLMSDIATPRLRAKSDSVLFNINHSKSLDLNGHSLYSEHAYFSGSALTYSKTRVFSIGSNVTFNLYSSQPGGAVHTGATVFYASTGSTVNLGKYTNPTTNEVYSGDNLSAYGTVLWLLEGRNGATINVDGGLYNRKSDYTAFLLISSTVSNTSKLAHSNVAVFKNATIVLGGDNVVRHENEYTGYETDPTHSTFTFENCTFIGSNNSKKNFSHELDYADININNCYFLNVRFGFDNATNKNDSTSYNVTADNLIFSGDSFYTPNASYDNVSADAFTVAKMDAYTKEYKDLKIIKGSGSYSYTVTVNGTSTTYSASNHCIAVNGYFDATVSATVMYTKNPVEVSFTAGDVTITEQWAQGSTPIIPDDATAAAEAMALAGYYSYKFDTPEVATEDVTYTAVFVPEFDIKLNLVLHSSFTYNVYLPIDESEAPTLTFTSIQLGDSVYDFENGTTTTINGVRYYVVSFEDVDPSNAAAATALTVTGTVAGTDFTIEKSISAVDYATLLVGLNISEASNNLAKAILAYVDSAYVFFGNTAAEEYAKAAEAAKANPIDVIAPNGTVHATADMNSFISSACLNLEGAPKLRFYLQDSVVTTPTPVTFKYVYNGKTVSVNTLEATQLEAEGGRYYVELELRAYEFAQDIEITCGDVTGYYNLATYYAGSNPYNVNLMNLVEALATYANAAKAYSETLAN